MLSSDSAAWEVAAALGSDTRPQNWSQELHFTQHSALGWVVALSFSKHCEFPQKTSSDLHSSPAPSIYPLGEQTKGLWTLLHQKKRIYQLLGLF